MRSLSINIGFIFCIALTITGLACSGNGSFDPVTPSPPGRINAAGSTHQLWGLWRFEACLESGTIDVVPLRHGEMNLNALKLLEPPPQVYLTVKNIKFAGNVVDCDISLRHPFIGLVQYTGFDVSGILIWSRGLS